MIPLHRISQNWNYIKAWILSHVAYLYVNDVILHHAIVQIQGFNDCPIIWILSIRYRQSSNYHLNLLWVIPLPRKSHVWIPKFLFTCMNITFDITDKIPNFLQLDASFFLQQNRLIQRRLDLNWLNFHFRTIFLLDSHSGVVLYITFHKSKIDCRMLQNGIL